MWAALRAPTWGEAPKGTAGLGVIIGTSGSPSAFPKTVGRAGQPAVLTKTPEEG